MTIDQIRAIVRRLAGRIARGEYEALVGECAASRLTPMDVREVVCGYGRTFVEPPAAAYDDLYVVAVRDAGRPTWSVWAPLWSSEEGRSDLTMGLTIYRCGDGWGVELDDLHVP